MSPFHAAVSNSSERLFGPKLHTGFLATLSYLGAGKVRDDECGQLQRFGSRLASTRDCSP
eukprot:3713094-Amphidinium_carterae.2